MASPEGLRLCFVNAPAAVLDRIFEFGWFLWLARPVDVIKDVGCYGNDIETTLGVLATSLSERARRLVDFSRRFPVDPDAVRVEYARPRVYAGTVRNRRGGPIVGYIVHGTGDGLPYERRVIVAPAWIELVF